MIPTMLEDEYNDRRMRLTRNIYQHILHLPRHLGSRLKLDQFSGVQNRPRIQLLSIYSSNLASSWGAESRKPSNTEGRYARQRRRNTKSRIGLGSFLLYAEESFRSRIFFKIA
ncbi:hypothetical protein OUZ56_016816 [Daphnia magna]|uniref:Uncharacterized protein n=1 Tax=Daphnia magna TaxID=35525 RepID=A0ABR0ARN8_9CRUS|nr:hypothetical protein OUZ56_016816 [Daphnia magna]